MKEDKEITIYDLAKHLKISAATVSRSLKDHPGISKSTKKKVQEAAKEMGYRSNNFARNLRKQKTNTIGVIVPKLNSYFVSSAIAGMEKIANENGYNLIISQSLESVKKEIANTITMFNSRVDGLLVSLAYDTENMEHFDVFFDKNIPVVFFDRVYEDSRSLNVIIDNYRNAYDVTKHLIDEGCKRIMHIAGNLTRNVYAERCRGYKDALRDAGFEFQDELLIVNELSEEAGKELGKKIIQMPNKPDAVFVANDVCAANCMQVIKTAGYSIPGDIAFAGFNNDPISKIVEPHLTTVNYPCYEMGEMAMRNLIDHLTGDGSISTTNKIILRSEIVVRASSLKGKGGNN
jgi:LacI family transcriptional regulator